MRCGDLDCNMMCEPGQCGNRRQKTHAPCRHDLAPDCNKCRDAGKPSASIRIDRGGVLLAIDELEALQDRLEQENQGHHASVVARILGLLKG